jgi:hypothetical protein
MCRTNFGSRSVIFIFVWIDLVMVNRNAIFDIFIFITSASVHV